MISELGRLNPEQLGVIARTSVMGYKHKDTRLDQIGRDLSVQYVLENSLRESGDHLRLTAQLIQVKDQTHLWSKDYDFPATDILTVEDDVAKAVAGGDPGAVDFAATSRVGAVALSQAGSLRCLLTGVLLL